MLPPCASSLPFHAHLRTARDSGRSRAIARAERGQHLACLHLCRSPVSQERSVCMRSFTMLASAECDCGSLRTDAQDQQCRQSPTMLPDRGPS